MLFDPPTADVLYEALLRRDPAYDGQVFVCVTSTGVFCRLTCPARKPRREHCRFLDTAGACISAGFRPCKRCHPLGPAFQAEPMIARLLDLVAEDEERRWSEGDIVALGFEPSTVRRAFRRHFGMTFLEMTRQMRLRRAFRTLQGGGRVIDAQIDAGFESPSSFRAAFARLLGAAPGSIPGEAMLLADWIDTPIGAMLAVADRRALHLLEFIDRKALPGELARLQKLARSRIGLGTTTTHEQVRAELGDYFAGRSAQFRTELALYGNEFTKRIWAELRTIPVGETRSYSEIARAIGHVSACRAVARANGANQIALVIPCHRVIGADGTLTGYGGGLWRKQALIEIEGKFRRASVGQDQPQTSGTPIANRAAISLR